MFCFHTKYTFYNQGMILQLKIFFIHSPQQARALSKYHLLVLPPYLYLQFQIFQEENECRVTRQYPGGDTKHASHTPAPLTPQFERAEININSSFQYTFSRLCCNIISIGVGHIIG